MVVMMTMLMLVNKMLTWCVSLLMEPPLMNWKCRIFPTLIKNIISFIHDVHFGHADLDCDVNYVVMMLMILIINVAC